MRIGIIGSGNIGGTMARLLEAAGHEVQVANSRGEPHTADEAARFGDVVLIAIPLHAIGDLPAKAFDGKIVIDANTTTPAVTARSPGSTTASSHRPSWCRRRCPARRWSRRSTA
jgi:8-hydroxy-5-deazaflavin:NADPH oxidoreductase